MHHTAGIIMSACIPPAKSRFTESGRVAWCHAPLQRSCVAHADMPADGGTCVYRHYCDCTTAMALSAHTYKANPHDLPASYPAWLQICHGRPGKIRLCALPHPAPGSFHKRQTLDASMYVFSCQFSFFAHVFAYETSAHAGDVDLQVICFIHARPLRTEARSGIYIYIYIYTSTCK